MNLDSSCPVSFLSSDEFFVRLPLLSRNVLWSCVRKFQECILQEHRTKAGYINLIRKDFLRQANQLMQFSTPGLLGRASPPAGHSTLHLSLVCQFVHNQYGTAISFQLLYSRTRWKPPEVAEDGISQTA